MLQPLTLPASLTALLAVVRPCLTGPSFATFTALFAGMIAQPGRRTVTGMWTAAGLAGVWHHSRAHWFFARARWSADQVGLAVAALVVARLLPPDAAVLIAVDDTLFRRSGRRVHAAAWCHDGSAKGPTSNRVAWGNCWVIAGLVVRLPFLDRPICLPVAARLWHKQDGPTKQIIAAELVTALTAACPGRTVHVVADAWYAGADGTAGIRNRPRPGLPPAVTLTSRLRANAALHAIATPIPGRGGRPRRRGAKLGTPTDLAAAATWTPTRIHRYGHHTTVTITETRCLWYGAYRSRAVRVILLRDPHTTTGYDLALITTDLTSPAEHLVERYAARWSIEVAIEDAKQITGVGQARNRTPHAVARTVPFGLYTQTLTVTWYTLHGHHPDIAAHRRRAAPWYTTKTQPAYHDMIIKLRRILIAARFRAGTPHQPTPEETLAVHLAWAEAAA
jgi:SRSO17 transposase